MIPLLFYSGAVIICSGLFYGYYYFWLRNNRFHHWNRYYLLAAVLGSLLIPLLNIPVIPGPAPGDTAILEYTARLSAVREQWLAPVTISVQKGLGFTAIISILYLLVLTIVLSRLITGYARMLRLIRKSETSLIGSHYKLINMEDERGPYSFFNFIFWNRFIPVGSPAGQQMLQHELLHIREKHSIDKMLMEIITGVCWINPFFYLIKKELEIVHEFSADEKAALLDDETHAYAELLLMKTLGTRQYAFPASLTNNFFHPPIKRRLQMLIGKNNGQFNWLKKAGILPVALCTFIFFGCQNNTKEEIARPADSAQIKATDIASVSVQKDQKSVILKLKNGQTITMPLDTFRTIPGERHDSSAILPPPPPPPSPNPIPANGAAAKEQAAAPSGENKVFTWAEQMPRFPGSTSDEGSSNKILRYLHDHIIYPAAARDDGIQGTVYIQFIVASDGSLKDVKAVSSHLGGGLEEEAAKVIKAMPAWIPGRQNGRPVTVQFTIPVKFMLQ